MENQVVNKVSAVDIKTVRATLIIPLAITTMCSSFDMLFHIKLGMLELNCFEQWLFWIFGTLISYFFPSFLASSVSLIWQYYFTDGLSGIKEGKGKLLVSSTFIYFCLYIVYLLFADTWFIFVFVLINIIYVWFVLNKCMDEKILKKSSIVPNDKVNNNPF